MIPLLLATLFAAAEPVKAAAPAQPATPAPAKGDARSATLEAMQEELKRSMERLKLEGHEAPYFLSYQVKDYQSTEILGRYGAIFDDNTRHDRKLAVDLRVGSYDFDSSGPEDMASFLGQEGQTYYAAKDAPLDGSNAALRNAFWLVTDEKYKESITAYLKKKGRGVYHEDPERGASFTREPPQRHVDPQLPFPFDADRWRAEAKAVSALFKPHKEIFDSAMKVTAEKQIRWFASSEGASIITEQTLYGVHVQAATRATDGQLLENSRDYYGATEVEMPSPERLRKDTAKLIEELIALRKAPVIDPYTGPAILAPEATGVLFHEAVGHRLEGERQDDDKEGRTFKGQIGRAVLPPFLSIVDDPTLRAFQKTTLNGFYRYDDQGVGAQRTVLIENGVLKTYLLSRKPVKPFARSNGHGRSQGVQPPIARMANLVVQSKKGVTPAELKKLLMAEARRQGKPYGLIIQDITGGNTNTMSYGYQAFKGTPRLVYRVDAKTGKEELVRGVELVGTPLTSINKISATSNEVRIFNGFCGAESGFVPVSTVAPGALITEIELQRTAKANERSPIIPSPW
jgi:predicted Zn-dependent protease